MQRDKVNLDIFWLKDESLEDADNLPEPDVIAAEIIEDLGAALEQFEAIQGDLAKAEGVAGVSTQHHVCMACADPPTCPSCLRWGAAWRFHPRPTATSRPWMIASGRGGQPGMKTSTGRTGSADPAAAYVCANTPPPTAQAPTATTSRGSGIASYVSSAASWRLRVITPVTRSRSAWRGDATKSMPRRWTS